MTGPVPGNLVMWSGIVGFALPPILSIVMQQGWSAQAKSIVAFVACLVAGAGTAWFAGNLGRPGSRWRRVRG